MIERDMRAQASEGQVKDIKNENRHQIVERIGHCEYGKHFLFFLAGCRDGQPKAGVELAPAQLLTLCDIPADDCVINLRLSGLLDETSKQISTNEMPIFRPKSVALACETLNKSMCRRMEEELENGHYPRVLTMGGDHSIAIGSISAISAIHREALRLAPSMAPFKKAEPIVFWIDAHADINTPSSTSSGQLHGCPLSLLLGLDPAGWKELGCFKWATNGLATMRRHVDPSRLVFLGTRDLDLPEVEIIKEENILEYSMDRLKAMSRDMTKIITEALERVDPRGEHPIHLSFDIDALDPKVAAATGTAVPDGLFLEEGLQIIKSLKETGRLMSMDLVEVNALLGTAEESKTTLESAVALIKAFVSL